MLLVDSYLKFTFADIFVPFIAPYEPLWTGAGIVGLYLLAIVVATSALRRRLDNLVWYGDGTWDHGRR